MSFTPFLGGKRICAGKTFVEFFAKTLIPPFIMNFDFEFVDEKVKFDKPKFNLMEDKIDIEVKVKVKSIS